MTHTNCNTGEDCACQEHKNADPFDPFAGTVADVFDEAEELLLRKHEDYGPLNISLSPGGALNGLRVRMWDKIKRDYDVARETARKALAVLRDEGLIVTMPARGSYVAARKLAP